MSGSGTPHFPLTLVVLATVFATASTGCSFLFARKPPSNAQSLDYPPDCTFDREVPVVDLLGAAGMGILGAANLNAQLNNRGAFFMGSPGMTIISFAYAGGYGASAAYGFAITSRCRDARARWLKQRGYVR
jgi:hypothetical protein